MAFLLSRKSLKKKKKRYVKGMNMIISVTFVGHRA